MSAFVDKYKVGDIISLAASWFNQQRSLIEPMKKISLNMLCSCVSRDIFGFNHEDMNDVKPPDQYEIKKYLNGISLLYADSPGIDLDLLEYNRLKNIYEEKYKKISNFWSRCLFYSLTKRFMDYITSESCDFLVIDNGFVRFSYLEFENGVVVCDQLHEFLLFLEKNNLVPLIKKNIYLKDIDDNLSKLMIKNFCNTLTKFYNPDKIIIIEVKPANLIYDSHSNTYSNFHTFTYYKSMASIYKYYFDLLVENLKGAHIITSPDITIANPYHKWGKLQLHFLNDYYEFFLGCIDDIALNNKSNAEILKRKSQFDDYIGRKYLDKFYEYGFNYYNSINTVIDRHKFYILKTAHKTTMLLDLKYSRLTHRHEPGFSESIVYSFTCDDFIYMYINLNNKVFYIETIDNDGYVSLSPQQNKHSIIFNGDKTVSICNSHKEFLSARLDGSLSFIKWNKAWEQFSPLAI